MIEFVFFPPSEPGIAVDIVCDAAIEGHLKGEQ